jgi:Holliday junction resolvase RusA-like endonuclease
MDARVAEQLPKTAEQPYVSIYLPGIPRGKGAPRSRIIHTPAGSRLIAFQDSETRSYEAQLKFASMAAMAGKPVLDCALRCRVTAMFPVPQSKSSRWKADALAGRIRHTTKPDIDNVHKCVDALKSIVFRDDSLFVESITRKFYSEKPGLLIEVWRWVGPLL